MANEENLGSKSEESSVTTIQASAGPSAATITEQQTKIQEYPQQEQIAVAQTINVRTNASAAKFKITGPATYTGSGTAFTTNDAPAGNYTITYDAVPGLAKPADETSMLPAGGSISFVGTYTEQPSLAARTVGLGSYDKNVRRVAGAALAALFIGLVVAAIGSWPKPVAALLWAGACSAVGWAIGFLFGIPRTLQTEGQSEVTQTEREAPPDNTTRSVTARRTTGVNTNLEQISDWLTKILVGVTLVQLGEANVSLIAAAALIAESLGGANMRSFASALMVYFVLTGFLGSYLLTRLFLQRAFEEDIEVRNG